MNVYIASMKKYLYTFAYNHGIVDCMVQPVQDVKHFYKVTLRDVMLGYVFHTRDNDGNICWHCKGKLIEPFLKGLGDYLLKCEDCQDDEAN